MCGKEIAHAAANNKRLVPIIHGDVAADSVPKPLGELNWIFCRESDDFEEATDTLIRALDTDLKWVRAPRVCSREQLSGTQMAGTTALFYGARICAQLSDGWRKLAHKKSASLQRCKPNTSSRVAKLQRGDSGLRSELSRSAYRRHRACGRGFLRSSQSR